MIRPEDAEIVGTGYEELRPGAAWAAIEDSGYQDDETQQGEYSHTRVDRVFGEDRAEAEAYITARTKTDAIYPNDSSLLEAGAVGNYRYFRLGQVVGQESLELDLDTV